MKAPLSALDEIFKWSAARPLWQRDALRRIIIGSLDAAVVKSLGECCRAANGAGPQPPEFKPTPLDATDVPTAAATHDAVTLESLGPMQGVNRLPSSQRIAFGPSLGITVVYGDNGAGKSGYARVLKKACRTRGAVPIIHPDAFGGGTAVPAKADIAIDVGGNRETVAWTDGDQLHRHLSKIFIFDGETAGNYLEQDGSASFTPHGLDVLPKLSKVCDAVRDSINQEINALVSEMSATAAHWKVAPLTSVGKVVGALTAATKDEQVMGLAGLTEEQAKRLSELADLLRTNPKQKAKGTRASADRLTAFAALVKTSAEKLSIGELERLKKLLDEASAAGEAARAFATGKFDASNLAGTGGEFWRKLWEAARDFSDGGPYAQVEFPVTDEGAQCVLCQQPIQPDAAERMKKYDAFYRDKSQQLAKDAAERLKGATQAVNGMKGLGDELKKVEADLGVANPEQLADIKNFVTKADDALANAKANLASGAWVAVDSIPSSPDKEIAQFAATLQARAKEEEGADDPASRKKLENERDELAAREWLGKAKESVCAQIGRYRQMAALEKALKETGTKSVTSMNTDLTTKIVTTAFRERFSQEVQELGLRTLTVQLQDISGAKGETKFGLRLEAAPNIPVRTVASEGEQRCIALAAFLAELSQSPHQSALVFDDPVSSLDHWHRERIAGRLVKESKTRQVVVFTHDAVFLNDLWSHVKQSGATGHYMHLAWNGTEPGHCYDGLPWECKSPEDRLDYLEKECGRIAATWGPKPSATNGSDMRGAYSWLRQTLERLVEKLVFADVVFRYRSYVNMSQLHRTVGFTQGECDEIDRIFKRCCNITDAHDAPQGKQAAIPEPTDLKNDIAATRTVISLIRARQKAALP